MKLHNNFLPIIIISIIGIILQACWKDKTLRDKDFDDIEINISPSYGIPLANLTILGKDLVNQINKDSSSNSFFVEYDKSNNDLCVIVYDKTNIPILLPPSFISFDSTVKFPLNFFVDLRVNGWTPKEAFVVLYADNSYTTNLKLNIEKLDYENTSGVIKPVSTDDLSNTNTILAATQSQTPKRSLVKDKININDPADLIFNGTDIYFQFDVLPEEPLNNNEPLNLNPVLKVPAHFQMDNLERRDTTGINLSDIAQFFNDSTISLQNITFYLKALNALPLNVKMQIYFADINYQITDSIQTNDILIKSGIPDGSYFVKSPTTTTQEINMAKEKFKKIQDSKYLIVKESFTSYNSSDVKLFKSNSIGIILSAKIDTQLQGTISEISN